MRNASEILCEVLVSCGDRRFNSRERVPITRIERRAAPVPLEPVTSSDLERRPALVSYRLPATGYQLLVTHADDANHRRHPESTVAHLGDRLVAVEIDQHCRRASGLDVELTIQLDLAGRNLNARVATAGQ